MVDYEWLAFFAHLATPIYIDPLFLLTTYNQLRIVKLGVWHYWKLGASKFSGSQKIFYIWTFE